MIMILFKSNHETTCTESVNAETCFSRLPIGQHAPRTSYLTCSWRCGSLKGVIEFCEVNESTPELGRGWRCETFMPSRQCQMELDLHVCLLPQTSHCQTICKGHTSALVSVFHHVVQELRSNRPLLHYGSPRILISSLCIYS